MSNEPPPSSVGETILPPASLTPEQEELCKRLDILYSKYGLKTRPSDMFRGAIFAMRPEVRTNNDWIAQAANSLREILYPFWSPQVGTVQDKKQAALQNYGSVRINNVAIQKLGTIFGRLNDLAHHGVSAGENFDFSSFTVNDFEVLLDDFEKTLFDALSRQIDVHNEIDSIMAEALKTAEISTVGEEIL